MALRILAGALASVSLLTWPEVAAPTAAAALVALGAALARPRHLGVEWGGK